MDDLVKFYEQNVPGLKRTGTHVNTCKECGCTVNVEYLDRHKERCPPRSFMTRVKGFFRSPKREIKEGRHIKGGTNIAPSTPPPSSTPKPLKRRLPDPRKPGCYICSKNDDDAGYTKFESPLGRVIRMCLTCQELAKYGHLGPIPSKGKS